jgi:hypothetical protein
LHHPAWEFLKDTAKFQSITVLALKAAPHAASKKHMNDELVDLTKSTGTPAVIHASRTMDTKKSKRRGGKNQW